MVKVTAHFACCSRILSEYRYGRAHIETSLSTAPAPPVPNTSAGWATLIDADGIPAPGGGPAFVAGAGNASHRGDRHHRRRAPGRRPIRR